jgi:hypothetical protein
MTFRGAFEVLFWGIFSKNDKSDNLNRTVTASPPSAARATKNRSRATPFVRFFSATFGVGVNASHCPITYPKRQLQRNVTRNTPCTGK